MLKMKEDKTKKENCLTSKNLETRLPGIPTHLKDNKDQSQKLKQILCLLKKLYSKNGRENW